MFEFMVEKEEALVPPTADQVEQQKRMRYLIHHRAHERFAREIEPLVSARCESDWLYTLFFAFPSCHESFREDYQAVLMPYLWEYFGYGPGSPSEDAPVGSTGRFVRDSLRCLLAADKADLYQLVFLVSMALFEPVRRTVGAQCAYDRFTPDFEAYLLAQTEALVAQGFSYDTVEGHAQQYIWALALYYETHCTLEEATFHLYQSPPAHVLRTAQEHV